jgi:2-iminobutanoate/2-iminopropanoate deaminase
MSGQIDNAVPLSESTDYPVLEPRGHYSLAVRHGDTVWVSGLVGNQRSGRTAGEQARAALWRLEAVLRESGLRLEQVVSTTVYTTDADLWADIDNAYRDVFGDHRPARAIIPGAIFGGDCLLEVQAIAAS